MGVRGGGDAGGGSPPAGREGRERGLHGWENEKKTKKPSFGGAMMVEAHRREDLAGVEKKNADWGRTVVRIDESKTPGQSSS
jgi:hypothetical protein